MEKMNLKNIQKVNLLLIARKISSQIVWTFLLILVHIVQNNDQNLRFSNSSKDEFQPLDKTQMHRLRINTEQKKELNPTFNSNNEVQKRMKKPLRTAQKMGSPKILAKRPENLDKHSTGKRNESNKPNTSKSKGNKVVNSLEFIARNIVSKQTKSIENQGKCLSKKLQIETDSD